MGSPGWNFCVICLSDINVKGPQGGLEKLGEANKGKCAKSVKFLIKCLLTTHERQANSSEEVLKQFLKLSGVIIGTGTGSGGDREVKNEVVSQEVKDKDEDNPDPDVWNCPKMEEEDEEEQDDEKVEEGPGKCSDGLHICENCEATAGTILDLHRKLNRLQKKLDQEVESVKETILRSSGWLGGISGGPEAFENFSKKFCQGDESAKAKETFEILKAFQIAVKEADVDQIIHESSPPVPVSRSAGHPTSILNSFLGETFPSSCVQPENVGAPDDLVKTEPRSQEPPMNEDDSESLRLGNFFDDFDTNYFTSSDVGSQRLSDVDLNAGKVPIIPPSPPLPSTTKDPPRARSKQLGRKKRKLIEKSPKKGKKSKWITVMEDTTMAKILSSITPKPGKKAKKDAIKVSKMLRNLPPIPEPIKEEKPDKSHLPPPFPPGPYIPPKIRKSLGGRYYPCNICGYKNSGIPMLEQHLRNHETEVKAHHCTECDQGFTTQQLYDFHQDQHYGHHKLICEICKDYFSTFHLPEHMKTHEGAVLYPCSLCSQYFASIESYVPHIRFAHVGGGNINCPICGNGFETKQTLLQHLHERHGVVQKYECGVNGCDKTFLAKDTLDRHRNNSHTGKFACDRCGKHLSSLVALQTHQRLHTPSEKPFKCNLCPNTFNIKMSLKNHMIKMHGAEKFKCESCDKEYTSIEGYHLHKKIEHSEFVRFCPVCNKKCASDAKLRAHMENHSTENNYMCEICGKSFVSRDKCSKHKRRTHGEKKFKCTYCSKGFTDTEYLLMHLRTHTGEKPFVCELCGKAFTQRSSVIIHKRKCGLGSSSSSSTKKSESVPEPEPEPGSSASANLFSVPNLSPF